jgi:hypothetical protein
LCPTELTQILNINTFVFKKSAIAKVGVHPMIGENEWYDAMWGT